MKKMLIALSLAMTGFQLYCATDDTDETGLNPLFGLLQLHFPNAQEGDFLRYNAQQRTITWLQEKQLTNNRIVLETTAIKEEKPTPGFSGKTLVISALSAAVGGLAFGYAAGMLTK